MEKDLLVKYLGKKVTHLNDFFFLGGEINVIFFSLLYAFLHVLECQQRTLNEFKI